MRRIYYMAFYDYIPGKKLDVSALSTYCDGISQHMSDQSCAYVLMSNDIANFVNDSNMRANSIEGFQMQMQGYVTALGGLCMANELDKQDIQTLKNQLDTFTENRLDGTEIVNNINKAINDHDKAIAERDSWNRKAEAADEWWQYFERRSYLSNAKQCGKEAENAWSDKTYWEGCARNLINFEALTLGLFYEGKTTRELAQRGLEQISTSFDPNTGTYGFPNLDWMLQMTETISGSIIDADGNIDWELVEQIADKDSDSISDFEYQMLAYAYINADVEDLNHFFTLFGTEKDIIGDMSELKLDKDKIDNITQQAYILQSQMLYYEMSSEWSEEELEYIRGLRADAIQRYTAIQQIANMDPCVFYAYEGTSGPTDYFHFRTVDFGFGDNSGLAFSCANSYTNYGQHTYAPDAVSIRISSTLPDNYLNTYVAGYVRERLEEEFDCSAGQIVFNNSANEVGGKIVEKVGTSLWGNGSHFVPIAGFVISVTGDIYEGLENERTINNTMDLNQAATAAENFLCTGVIIEVDGNSSLALYDGPETAQRIETYSANTGIDASKIYSDPVGVFNDIYEHMDNNSNINEYHNLFIIPGYDGK